MVFKLMSMSKLSDLKDKLKGIFSRFSSKSKKTEDEKEETKEEIPPSGPIGLLSASYREGSTATRFQIVIILALICSGSYWMYQSSMLFIKHKSLFTENHTKNHGFDRMTEMIKRESQNRRDINRTVSIDKIKFNARRKDGTLGFISISMWVVCDTPKTAMNVEYIYPKLHDALIIHIQEIKESEVTSDDGKIDLQKRMIVAMNTAMDYGKIEKVFFYDMVFE